MRFWKRRLSPDDVFDGGGRYFLARTVILVHSFFIGETVTSSSLDELLQKTLPIGKKRLRDDEEFIPFAAVLTRDEEMKYVGPETEPDYPEPPDTLEYLIAGLTRMVKENQVQTTAIVASVRLTIPGENEESDALQIDLESPERSVNAVLPYETDENTEEVLFGELLQMDVPPKIFPEDREEASRS